MTEEQKVQTRQKQSADVLPKLGQLDIPSIANSLADVYKAGSMPLALIFVAAVVIIVLLLRGALEALPWVTYLVGGLLTVGVLLFVAMSWLAYRQWRDDLNARVENRRMEMDLYVRLSTSNSEIQDKFVLNLLSHVGELAGKTGSTPEGRREEVRFLAESLGTLLRDFMTIRNQLRLPEFTAVFPENDANVRKAGPGIGIQLDSPKAS